MHLKVRFSPVFVIIIVLSLIGMLVIYYGTTWGPWAYSDSTEYIASARNFLAGRGFSYPAPSGELILLTLHPPFYPFILSALSFLGMSLIEAARWSNIFLFGAIILFTGIFTYYLYRSAWLAISLSAVILTTPNLVDISTGAMSEILFLFTVTLSICSLIAYTSNKGKVFLILAAIATSLALLTRYPGLIAALTGILGILLAAKLSWRQRITAIVVFSVISLTPIVIWLLWIYRQSGSLGDRQYYLPQNLLAKTINLRINLMESFWSWLPFQKNLPAYSYNTSRNVIIISSIIILALFSLVISKKLSSKKSADQRVQEVTLPLLWFIFIFGYVLLIAAGYLFSEPLPDLNSRTLLPVQFGLGFMLLALITSASNEFKLPVQFGWGFAALTILLCLPNAQKSWNIIQQYHESGSGYTSKTWQQSNTISVLAKLPLTTPIISNQSAAILLLINRPAYELCRLPCTPPTGHLYGDDPDDPIQEKFRDEGGALAYFYPYCGAENDPRYSDTLAQIERLTQGLKRYFSSCDGAIFFYPSN